MYRLRAASEKSGISLEPAYDMAANALISHKDKEQLALTLNEKKKSDHAQ
jgi:hypothetical protein